MVIRSNSVWCIVCPATAGNRKEWRDRWARQKDEEAASNALRKQKDERSKRSKKCRSG